MSASTPIPENEAERLAALHRYRILDTEREQTFDRIADMAASMCRAKTGSINFVDADRVWIKAGPRMQQMRRADSFCARTIMSDDVFVVSDVAKVPALSGNPIVAESGTRFYAAAPLITRDGFRIGTLCVVDVKPHRGLQQDQKTWLVTLAQLVMNELDVRRELAARNEAERDLELMNQLMMAIAEAPGARDALDTSVRLISIAIGAVHGAVFEVAPHRDAIQLIGAYGATPLWQAEIERVRHATIDVASSLSGLALTEDRPVITDVAEAAKRFPQLGEKVARGSQTAITIPLKQADRRFAFHFFFEKRPTDAGETGRRIAELADKVRPALVRKVAEERIAWLQSMIMSADDAAVLMMPDNVADPESPLRIAFVNPATTRITGYRAEELTGKLPEILYGRGAELNALQSLRPGEPLRRELQLCHRDGGIVWADVNAVATDVGARGERQIVALIRDTTERRKLEQRLREREWMFHLMFSSAPVPMMLLDVKAQRYVEVNDAATSLFGYSREQFLRMSAEAIRAPEEVDRYKEVVRTPVPQSGRRGLWRYIKADGSEVLVDVAVHPFRFQGRAMAIIVTVDVTEQKRIEEQIRRARDAAEAVSRAKSDLLANMSHELRTPLNAIIGFSQIMREELFGPLGGSRYSGYVADILESAHHLLAVINDILDLAKIEANSLQLNEKEIDPQQVVNAALRLVRPRADEAGIQLEFVNSAPGVILFADEIAMKRVLVNLLTNAVKFSETGTRITVDCRPASDGGVSLSVTDRGIGMAPEDIPVALTPFQQVDIGLRRKYEGTGLGLPIAKQLMELHGGTLAIESALGVGTKVTISLPASRVLQAAPATPNPVLAQRDTASAAVAITEGYNPIKTAAL